MANQWIELNYDYEKRLRYFENMKVATGCRTTAELWEAMHCTDSESLYHAACFRAVTAKVILVTDQAATKEAEAEVDLAITWLQKSIANGYKDFDAIQRDLDLDSIRGREEFKKLIASIR